METAIAEIPESYLKIKGNFEDYVDDFKFDIATTMIEAISKGGIGIASDLKLRFDISGEHISNMTSELK